MCVIIVLKPKQMIDKEMLTNACFNNWHSYGLVTKTESGLDVVRKLPKNGEIDPEEVYDLLQDNFEYERFLHVRHNTAGATNLENTHPFDVYYDEKTGERIVFMHNGTLYEYKSKKFNANGSMEEDKDGNSDSKNFTDEILIPFVASNYGTGTGDIENPHLRRLLKQFWPAGGSNRGILISAKKTPLLLGDWKFIGEEGNKLLVSNNDYFDDVIRGPEKERRRLREEEEKRKQEAAEAKKKNKNALVTTPTSERVITPYSAVTPEIKVKDYFELSEDMSNITSDWDLWDPEGMRALGYATKDELEQLYSSKNDCLIVMDAVFTEYAKTMARLETLQEKMIKQEKHIEEMAKRLKSEGKKVA